MDGRDVPWEHGDPDDSDAEDAERHEEASALDDAPQEVEVAKLAVLLASLLAGVFGAVILRSANRPAARTSRRHSRT